MSTVTLLTLLTQFTLLTLLTLFTWFTPLTWFALLTLFVLLKLHYTAKTLACMPNILLGKVRTVLKLEVELLSKMADERMGEWSGYPLDCYDIL